MSRFYRQVVLLNFVIFTAVMLLIRAQPYNDHELRALLMPEGCEMPCFMGIRPGVTTVDEAVKLLKASGWVKEINEQLGGIEWAWNGLQPTVINSRSRSYVQASNGKTVDSIMVILDTPMIEIWWSSEQPPLVQTAGGFYDQFMIYVFWYPERGMTVQNSTGWCEAPVKALTANENVLYIHSVETVMTEVNRAPDILKRPLKWFSFKRIC